MTSLGSLVQVVNHWAIVVGAVVVVVLIQIALWSSPVDKDLGSLLGLSSPAKVPPAVGISTSLTSAISLSYYQT